MGARRTRYSDRQLKLIAVTLVALGTLVLVVGVGAAFFPEHDVYPRMIAHPVGATVLGLALYGYAGAIYVPRPQLRVMIQVLLSFGLAIVACVGWVSPLGPYANRSLLATSAHFDAVSYRPDRVEVRIETHGGLLSRDGAVVACFESPEATTAPAYLLDKARFVGDDTVEFTTKDGEPHDVTFDPGTLSSPTPLDRCSGIGA